MHRLLGVDEAVAEGVAVAVVAVAVGVAEDVVAAEVVAAVVGVADVVERTTDEDADWLSVVDEDVVAACRGV